MKAAVSSIDDMRVWRQNGYRSFVRPTRRENRDLRLYALGVVLVMVLLLLVLWWYAFTVTDFGK